MDAVVGIKQSNSAFCSAFAEHDIDKVSALVTQDVWFMAPNAETMVGKDTVVAAYKGMMDSGVNGVTLDSTGIEQFGDTANETGEFTLSINGELVDRGKYLVIWKYNGDRWQVYRDIINTSLPAPE